METQIADGTIGAEGKYDVDFADGKINIDLGYKGEQAEAGVYLKLDLLSVLRIAASKTENKIDDNAVEFIAGLL